MHLSAFFGPLFFRKARAQTLIAVMKITIVLMTVFCLNVAASGYSQNITLSEKASPLKTVFRLIERQSNYKFFYNYEMLEDAGNISITVKGMPLKQVLDLCFRNQPLSYEIVNKTIVVKRKEFSDEIIIPVVENLIDVTGKVVNGKGEAVSGATVTVKGSGKKVVAGNNGEFSLKGLDEKTVLLISCVGYQSMEVAVNGRTSIRISLQNAIQSLEDVTVSVSTGYQEIRPDRVTGAVTVITAKDLENNSFRTIDQILEGKVPGLYSYSTSGAPGTRSNIRIRGDNSLSGNKEPLWVVDGLPLQGGVASINVINTGNIQESILDNGIGNLAPSDIESITILKDAAASAIYGARAANGVIVIKTKRGKAGKTTINYNGSYGIGDAPSIKLDFMNSREKIRFEETLMEDFNKSWEGGTIAKIYDRYKKGYLSKVEYEAEMDKLRAINTDWFDVIFRKSKSQSHSLSMRGGTENTTYFTSINYNKQQGILENNKYDQIGGRIEIVHHPIKKLDVLFNLNGSFRKSNEPNSVVDPFKYAVFANPYEKPFDENGNYFPDASYLGDNRSGIHFGPVYGKFNILRELNETGTQSIGSDLTGRFGLRYEFPKGFKADVSGAMTYSSNNTEDYAGAGTYSSFSGNFSTSYAGYELPESYNNGYLREGTGRTSSYALRGLLSYTNDVLPDHSFSVTAGTEISGSKSNNSFHRFTEYNDFFRFVSMPSYTADLKYADMRNNLSALSGTAYAEDKSASFFGAFTYTLKDKYVFNINSRFDGASTIGSANRFTPLWSASTRWNIMRENFMKNSKIVSDLALRVSYGYTGNIDRSAYPISLVFLGGQRYNNEYTAQSFTFPNPNIKWERKEDKNIGLDFSFLDNILGGSFNYYSNTVRDLMGGLATPDSYGRSSVQINALSLNNTGWDFNFNLRLKLGKDVRWINSFNIGQNKNMIKKGYLKSVDELNWRGGADNIEGYATGTTFGYRFAGVNPLTGNAMIYLSEESRKLMAAAQKKEINQISDKLDTEEFFSDFILHDKVYRSSMENLGSLMPKYNGGFTSTVTWKSLELRAGFSYATGFLLEAFNERKNAPSGANRLSEIYVSKTNRLQSAMDRWRTIGDITNVPRYQGNSTNYHTLITDDKYEKGDYLSVRDITLTYNLKSDFLSKAGIKSCRIGAQVNNLKVFSRYSGLDATKAGAFNYPSPRTYMVNLSLGL